MKKLLLLLCFLMMTTAVMPQETKNHTIKGIIVDSLSSIPESYATVRILSPVHNAPPIAIGLTDSTGVFRITVKNSGNYLLSISSIGHKPFVRDITIGSSEVLDLGTLRIGPADNILGTATVKAQRPLVKAEIDKITYNLADDPAVGTSTLLEMLRKVPMVTVDGEDNIKVNGNSSFKVYVNGKPNQIMSANPSQIFKNYPATAVKKIEVITNPSAKYDAEGVSGVLNIITNMNTDMSGYTFTPSLRMDNTSVMGSFFGMAQVGKFTISAHYGNGYYHQRQSKGHNEREVFKEPINHLLLGDNTSKNTGMFQFGSLDASYEFSPKDLISISSGINGWSLRGDTYHHQKMYDINGNNIYSYLMHSHQHESHPNINASADYQHTFKESRTLTLSYRLGAGPSHVKNSNTYSDIINMPYALKDIRYYKKDRSYEHTGQMDFSTPLGKDHRLSTGLKYIYRLNRSENKESSRLSGTESKYVPDNASLLYRHRGDISAAYLEYNYQHKRIAVMGGARYEYYHINVSYPDGKRSPFKSDIDDLVPTVSIAYNLTETQMLRLGYNMRIARPDINALSPYVTQISPEAVNYGNPNLKSAKANNIEMGYSSFSQKFNLNATLTYSFTNNGLTSYSFIDGSGIQNTTYNNFLHQKSLNLAMFLNWNIFDGTSLNLNGRSSYNDLRVHETGDHNSGFSIDCWSGITQKLPLKLKAELWLGGHTRNVQLQGRNTSFLMYNINFSRTFLYEDRLQLSLGAGNFIDHYHNFKNETLTEQFHFINIQRIYFLRFGIGVSYRFGSLKASVKKAARTIKNNDVSPSNNKSQQQQGGMNIIQ